MSRNGSGTYTLPAGNPVVAGTTITSTWGNNTMNDLAAALTDSVAADGQTPMTGDLNLNNNDIKNIANGTSAAPSISPTSDANTGIFFPAADTIAFTEGGAEAMRIDASGNVGINTSSPNEKLSVVGNVSSTAWIGRANGSAPSADAAIYRPADNTLGFSTSSAERMRIDSSGNLLVGTTTLKTSVTVQGQLSTGVTGSAGSGAGLYIYANDTLSDNSFMTRVSVGNGTTQWFIGNQSITTSSDARLKDNIKPTERNALELLNQWEIVDHTWNDPSDSSQNNRNSRGVWTGVIAQQVQPITPWLVNKPTEDVDPLDNSINPWTMDFGYAVPLLVKAIQELKATVDAQTARIAALEA
jgi:hypothetical protein